MLYPGSIPPTAGCTPALDFSAFTDGSKAYQSPAPRRCSADSLVVTETALLGLMLHAVYSEKIMTMHEACYCGYGEANSKSVFNPLQIIL